MPDYKLRSSVIESGLVAKVKQISKNKWDSRYDYKALDMIQYDELFLRAEDPEAYAEAEKAAHADFTRNTRLSHRIRDLISMGNAIFLTLTFRDDVLEKTNEETRRRYVTRFLKEECKYYIANIDYGTLHDREHYHAVCVPWCCDVSFGSWRFGFAFASRIHAEHDSLRIAKYCTKLCNHAIKSTCKRAAVIYSRIDWHQHAQDINVFYTPPDILCRMRLVESSAVTPFKKCSVHPFT